MGMALVEELTFDLDEYIASELTFPVGDEIRLVVLFDKQADIQRLEETPISIDQKIVEQSDGRYKLSVCVENTLQPQW